MKHKAFVDVRIGAVFRTTSSMPSYFIKTPIIGPDQYNAIMIHTDDNFPSYHSGRPIRFESSDVVITDNQDGLTKEQLQSFHLE